MGKHDKKSGKGRLDKFYWLAKEQGYRARSAFKLVQLNKKYGFLENAHCCIDLCAAPGGWLQVASKHMPPHSLIVGVDLVPIKPIPRCITFAEDINSLKCRDQLRANLKDWSADVVLHDGAPNVGAAWVQDAYAQSELTLQALRLAVEFLTPGGTFVTKVFRSKDYNNLMWVFNQLFHHVEATKPPSSRNVSAEIFVVCQRFKNIARIDPKFLDPRFVFKELDTAKSEEMNGVSSHNLLENVMNPEKVRRKREGYEDGNYTLYKTIGADAFIRGADAIAMLGTYNRITFDTDADKALLSNPATTADIKANCEDLKLLGRGDFATLFKWRKTIRAAMQMDRPTTDESVEAQTVEIEPMNEEEAIDEELVRLKEEAAKRTRKDRRRRNEARNKTLQKLQLNMTTNMDIGQDWTDDALNGGDEMFSLDHVEGKSGAARNANLLDAADAVSDEEEAPSAEESDDDSEPLDDRERRALELEAGMDAMYKQYQEHLQMRDAKFRAREARRKSGKYEEWGGIDAEKKESDEESDGGEEGFDSVNRRKFHEDTYDSDDAEDDEDERAELQGTKVENPRKKHAVQASLLTSLESNEEVGLRKNAASSLWYDNPIFQDMIPMESFASGQHDQEEDEEEEEEGQEEDDEEEGQIEEDEAEDEVEEENSDQAYDNDLEIVPSEYATTVPDGAWDINDEDIDAKKHARIAKHGLHTEEAASLAHALVNRQMTKSDLIDRGFSKHHFNDKIGAPEWFLEDENKHYRANIPISKEAVEALRAKQRALDARPIKKVAEAKARKKHRVAMRLEKAQKRADAINENTELSEREKAENINKIMARNMAKKAGAEHKAPQLVVAKGVNRGVKGRPKGTKGRYKMVDPRMKKELRANKRVAQRDGKRRSSGHKNRRIPNGY
ncbi:AdoMet-dependent rRNA methyltransferase spb1 [Malassezia vespertilionis]|uniref:Spb1p n=1 Tax=Malassezia vespertilionis TaxID=2020962 RepID=A0A2N1J746_9BASI|nr:AdoMet-dependent rRNA methyltransferase spb1 [Malassezia vespertilionis]PKI82385.1 Spb1p [Malassezia vespertilionis]WFD07985.1 AdoMet-dependent rRNA methyltransferase spb1 [Malassezia vespertilionis]